MRVIIRTVDASVPLEYRKVVEAECKSTEVPDVLEYLIIGNRYEFELVPNNNCQYDGKEVYLYDTTKNKFIKKILRDYDGYYISEFEINLTVGDFINKVSNTGVMYISIEDEAFVNYI